MSKQYLTVHTLDAAHPTDIFSLAATPYQLLSASGSSTILVHSTTSPDFLLAQELRAAHKLGVHHIAVSKDGCWAASAGFGGECRIWRNTSSIKPGEAPTEELGKAQWELAGEILKGMKAGELWAIALSSEGRYLAASAYDGRINVWDLLSTSSTAGNAAKPDHQYEKIREYETKGSFGLSVALSPDGRFTASGHENGSVYIFSNDTGRLLHSLPGLIKPVRALAFSPASKLLAAGGDSRVIALYDVSSGEQVANMSGHNAWITSLDFSNTGEWLLSSSMDGKCKVWGMETRTCVATHAESDKMLWSTKWLPKREGARAEMFAAAGAGRSISFYREASGG